MRVFQMECRKRLMSTGVSEEDNKCYIPLIRIYVAYHATKLIHSYIT